MLVRIVYPWEKTFSKSSYNSGAHWCIAQKQCTHKDSGYYLSGKDHRQHTDRIYGRITQCDHPQCGKSNPYRHRRKSNVYGYSGKKRNQRSDNSRYDPGNKSAYPALSKPHHSVDTSSLICHLRVFGMQISKSRYCRQKSCKCDNVIDASVPPAKHH